MSVLRPIAVFLVLSAPWIQAQEPASQPDLDYRVLTRQVDTMLRKARGMRLELDEAVFGTLRSRKPTNKVYWTFSGDRRLVGIEVEPLVAEDDDTTLLIGALLVSLSAVDTVQEGIRMAHLVREAQESDGRARMIRLRHGVRLYRMKPEGESAKFHIGL